MGNPFFQPYITWVFMAKNNPPRISRCTPIFIAWAINKFDQSEAPKPYGFNPQAAKETVKHRDSFPTGVSRGFVFLVVFLFRDETLWKVSTKMGATLKGTNISHLRKMNIIDSKVPNGEGRSI